ncbi:MAG: TIGR01777 family oxidoreductase [Frankiaceae bacterium]|nr:TIGR01777 family oxidoreductase [Frankiaceae bacterium]
MRVAVTGASGLIGSALVRHLRGEGHDVVRFVRHRTTAPDELPWDPAGRALDPALLDDVDAVVHLAGAGVADKRWTTSYKQTILRSRVDGTTTVAAAIASSGRPSVLLSSSAVGWYGDTGDRVTDETGPPGEGFLADVCRQWEDATEPARASCRVAHLRTGYVLAKDALGLSKQARVAKLGLGAPLGSGRQWTSWISLRDEVRAIAHLLTADVSGAVNLVTAAPVTNRDMTRAINKAVHRPTFPVPVPGIALKAALGPFAAEGVLIGQRLQPAVLQRSGFAFADPELDAALASVL